MHTRTARQRGVDSVAAITWESQPGIDSGAAITWDRPARLAGLTHFQKASQPGNVFATIPTVTIMDIRSTRSFNAIPATLIRGIFNLYIRNKFAM